MQRLPRNIEKLGIGFPDLTALNHVKQRIGRETSARARLSQCCIKERINSAYLPVDDDTRYAEVKASILRHRIKAVRSSAKSLTGQHAMTGCRRPPELATEISASVDWRDSSSLETRFIGRNGASTGTVTTNADGPASCLAHASTA